MLTFLTIAIMLAVAYCFFREGVLTSICMTVNVFVAGLVAFNFYEPLAAELESMVNGTFVEGCEDALSLFVLLALPLGVLRVITNNLANAEIALPALAQQIASVIVGLFCGFLLAGFLTCMMQTLPYFMNFEAEADPSGPKLRRVLPPDRVWLAMMSRASTGPLANGSAFDPEGTYSLRYAKLRRKKEKS